jgi:hypothetical protein
MATKAVKTTVEPTTQVEVQEVQQVKMPTVPVMCTYGNTFTAWSGAITSNGRNSYTSGWTCPACGKGQKLVLNKEGMAYVAIHAPLKVRTPQGEVEGQQTLI